MKKLICLLSLACFISLPLFLLTGCFGSSTTTDETSTTPKLSNAVMASDVDEETYEVLNQTDRFTSETATINVVADLSDGKAGETVLKAEWYSEDDNTILAEATVTSEYDNGPIWFYISKPTDGWDEGDYYVVLYADDTEQVSKSFTISASENEEIDEPTISNPVMASEVDEETYEVITEQTDFPSDSEIISVVADLSDAKADSTVVAAKWYSVDSDELLVEASTTVAYEEGPVWFYLTPTGSSLQTGDYYVVLYADDVEQVSISFSIVE